MNLRDWQKDAFAKCDVSLQRDSNEIVPVNACVGAGKTAVACHAIGKFIMLNRDCKTVQLLSTPRIRLCDQQRAEVASWLELEFGLKDGVDCNIVPVDCTKHEFSKKSSSLHGKHVVFVICKESLLGYDEENGVTICRWMHWKSKFMKWAAEGRKLGVAAFDEAHNFEDSQKIFLEDEHCIHSLFKCIVMMSGTPSAMQKELSKAWKENVCSCSPKTAMENGWIVKPSLNLVLGGQDAWARAIVAMLNRELKICENEVFIPRMMINCSGIDDIKRLNELPYFREHAGKDFHFISLHSMKAYQEDNIKKVVTPMVDCKEVSADEAYSAIEQIDAGTYFKDNLPTVVAQVQMLGEGINVNSFNAMLTSSSSDKTAMQQIGRIVRNFAREGKTKVAAGHANVYVLTENVQSTLMLLKNLEEFELTDECFRWGDKIDVSTSSGMPSDDEDMRVMPLNVSSWEPIDPDNDIGIIELMKSLNGKLYKKAAAEMFKDMFSDNDNDGKADIEELEDLLCKLSASGFLKLYSKSSFSAKDKTISAKAPTNSSSKATLPKEKDNGKKANVESKKASLQYDILMKWMFDLHHAVNESARMKWLWNKDRKMCIEGILGSAEVAEFLDAHLSKKMSDRIAK